MLTNDSFSNNYLNNNNNNLTNEFGATNSSVFVEDKNSLQTKNCNLFFNNNNNNK